MVSRNESSHVVPALHVHDATTLTAPHRLGREGPRPILALTPVSPGEVGLGSGLFRDRRELGRRYVLELRTDRVLQNHLLEAGIRIDEPTSEMHQGWESPHCQLRGHFMGHWLSAVARFAAVDQDPLALARVKEALLMLKRCQDLNQGKWVGSIPEKYFEILADNRAPVWSPQYTLHKTMMGLLDAYRYCGEPLALDILERAAEWFLDWTSALTFRGQKERIYSGECSGMLELWAELYDVTNKVSHLELASRYASPDLFWRLAQGEDPITRNHANATIPWIHGAMRAFEVTGDPHFLTVVQRFWHEAVESRGMFATTGNNAGEFFIPRGEFGQYLGSRTQEHCTVYNMIRVAHDLLCHTGDSRYADYIERSLYNGILSQQNPNTGMVCYFLPLEPGAQKRWGSRTQDFWCCHGTLVQAQAMFEDLVYYRAADGVSVCQFITSSYQFETDSGTVRLLQTANASGYRLQNQSSGPRSALVVELKIEAPKGSHFTLRVRRPEWLTGPASVIVNGEQTTPVLSKDGFYELSGEWHESTVVISLPKSVTREPLPGAPNRFALLDGPVVLAALSEQEPEVAEGPFSDETLTPQYEHQYIEGRDWQTGHYLLGTTRGTVRLVPLYEVVDETYSVYFAGSASATNPLGL